MNTEAINEMTEWFMGEYIALVNGINSSPHIVKQEGRHGNIIVLEIPIDSIDGVKLEHIIIKLYKNSMDLIIVLKNHEYSEKITGYCDNRFFYVIRDEVKDECFTKETICTAIETIFKQISDLSFNNCDGHFTDKPLKPLPSKALASLGSLGKAKLSKGFGECCVCYETTKTHFSECNHVVCGRCVSNMKRPLKCPMCRAKIIDYSESEEE
jgi:hypothetical protein